MRHVLSIILTTGLGALLAISLASCGETKGDGGGSTRWGPPIVAIAVTPENPSISLYGTQQFRATATFEDGSTGDVTTEVAWSTTNGAVAATDSGGLATSKSSGTTTVVATDTDTGISNTTGLSSGCTATVTVDTPVSSGTSSNVTLSLPCFSEATGYSCTAGSANLCILSPVDCEDSGDTTFTFFRAGFAACNANGVTATGCNDSDGSDPDVLEFNGSGFGLSTATATGINATGFTDIQVDFRAAFATATDAGEGINLEACCGGGCTPSFIGNAPTADDGGTDAWSGRGPFSLGASFDDCSSMTLKLSQSSTQALEAAHLDDFTVSGTPGITLTPQGGGTYTGGFTTCAPDTVPVSCTWSTTHGTFPADIKNVTFN